MKAIARTRMPASIKGTGGGRGVAQFAAKDADHVAGEDHRAEEHGIGGVGPVSPQAIDAHAVNHQAHRPSDAHEDGLEPIAPKIIGDPPERARRNIGQRA